MQLYNMMTILYVHTVVDIWLRLMVNYFAKIAGQEKYNPI